MNRLENHVAIVTGAGSGHGTRHGPSRFAREGARVVVADYNLEGAQETVGLIGQKQAVAFKVNVTNASEAEALVAFSGSQFGALNLLVNNAGIGVPGTILNTSEEDWDRIFAVNVKGIYQCSRFAIPRMLEQGGGTIINVSSIAAIVAVVDRAAYGASKGAVLALTKAPWRLTM